MVPGSALRGLVAPIMVAHDLPGVLGALDTIATTGPRLMNVDEVVVEALADVLLVVPGERLLVERALVEGDDAQALGLEPAEDRPDQPALDGVGLEQDEGAIRHDRRGYRRVGHADLARPCHMRHLGAFRARSAVGRVP